MTVSGQSEGTVPRHTPSELLAQALETLQPEDRQRVTAWCLSRLSGPSSLGWVGRQERQDLLSNLPPTSEEFRVLYTQQFGSGSVSSGRGQQVVPVRLPADLHARLRTWSTEHGFSMATVVRGLVSRFLDGQAPVTTATAPDEAGQEPAGPAS
jgi:hypothetical protein